LEEKKTCDTCGDSSCAAKTKKKEETTEEYADRRKLQATLCRIQKKIVVLSGKGGVGKTSIACATAIQLAEAGKRVLLVSTDPASNVGQVFGVDIGNRVTPIPAVPRLSALEIDPEAAASAYRERLVGPVRGVLPDDVVKGIEESLSGACTTEIAAFDEFTALLTNAALTADYEHIIFDTAPTGHTIRLLQLPGAWSGFLEAGKGDASCLGPLAGLESSGTQYKSAVEALADPLQTRLVLVARAQQRPARGRPNPRRTGSHRPQTATSRHQRHPASHRSRYRPTRRCNPRTGTNGAEEHPG